MIKVDFNKNSDGLVPAIIQDSITKNVLMLGYMNEEALQKTLETKKVTFWSRSRNTLWTKGETSGNFLDLVSVLSDCDNDTLLIKVEQTGPACHTGSKSCFFKEIK
jgi:phosphoribosyl-ATP pyrophosphohydrolase/phosphoribosyl-AMP cyclohydrolase